MRVRLFQSQMLQVTALDLIHLCKQSALSAIIVNASNALLRGIGSLLPN